MLSPHLPSSLKGLIVAGLAAAFVLAVRRHARYRRQRERAEGELLVVTESLRRAGGAVVAIRSGARPADPAERAALIWPMNADATAPLTAQELDDLDIYAEPVGVFGLLNRCSTRIGARRLRDIIEHPHLTADPIRLRQKSVAALADDLPTRIAAMGAISRLRNMDPALDQLVAAVNGVSELPHPGGYRALRFYSIFSAVAILAGALLAFDGHYWGALALTFMPVNFVIFSLLLPTLSPYREAWPDLASVVAELAHAARDAATARGGGGATPAIDTLRAELAALAEHAPPLSRRLGWFDVGGMLQLILNGVVLYDLHAVAGVTSHAVRHRDALLRGIAALAQLEALLSLACFAGESAGPVCFPIISDTGPDLHIRAGRHPLIDPKRAVPNDVELDGVVRLLLITGSNMSGKSTYLRMTGVSCLLAQIGSAVLAEDMHIFPVCLVSDLNVRDQLGAAESYFLAEVRHVRRLLDPPADCSCVLGLLDEPFRGTNSDERFACTAAVLEYLNQPGKLSIVSTHEQQLAARVAEMPGALNCHFHESLGPAGLTFDYRMNRGRATTRNALHVLEREGYPREILQRAREICASPAPAPGAA